MELGAQLDNLRMELAGDNNGTSGNSLFGEVGNVSFPLYHLSTVSFPFYPMRCLCLFLFLSP